MDALGWVVVVVLVGLMVVVLMGSLWLNAAATLQDGPEGSDLLASERAPSQTLVDEPIPHLEAGADLDADEFPPDYTVEEFLVYPWRVVHPESHAIVDATRVDDPDETLAVFFGPQQRIRAARFVQALIPK